jgi:hypothetical protein
MKTRTLAVILALTTSRNMRKTKKMATRSSLRGKRTRISKIFRRKARTRLLVKKAVEVTKMMRAETMALMSRAMPQTNKKMNTKMALRKKKTNRNQIRTSRSMSLVNKEKMKVVVVTKMKMRVVMKREKKTMENKRSASLTKVKS